MDQEFQVANYIMPHLKYEDVNDLQFDLLPNLYLLQF